MSEKIKFKIWWIPQLGIKNTFEWNVESIEEGKNLMRLLSDYDNFQYVENVKGDYCNLGSLAWKHSKFTGGKWWDVDVTDEYELEEVLEAIEELKKKSEESSK